ncbi:peptide chain release factor N(5)-glutamine methyltransferase [Rufibacter roseus]|uniref:Release factor glutamine methyltransferase n=2 Tax=Rufibacter roseus TaxID=1567108 RepID=A0ABW2DK63_9BACT
MPEYRLFFQKLRKTDMKYTIGNLLESVSLRLEALYEQPEARTMAEWLLQHELGKGRMGLFEVRSNIASEGLVTKVDTFVERLLQHEPLQYVIGEASFYGRDFIVSPAVLIPRPETEELVQLIIKTYQSQPGVAILDIGTGSGCIPVTLAAELPLSTVIGLDVSADALTIARQNANKSGQKVEWLCQDILKEIPAVAPSSLDVIVSNPPYVLEQEKELMRQNVLNFEPHLALFVPDTDPLLFYRRIAEIAPQLLKNGGRLFFEINERYAASTADILLSRGFCQVEVIKDLYGKERILQAVWQ